MLSLKIKRIERLKAASDFHYNQPFELARSLLQQIPAEPKDTGNTRKLFFISRAFPCFENPNLMTKDTSERKLLL